MPNTTRPYGETRACGFCRRNNRRAITLPGLGIGTLWDNSETAYGEVAREILLTHDWVVMHLNGAAWFVQPPLYFWIAAIFCKAFGLTSLAFRLPAALATILMAALPGTPWHAKPERASAFMQA